MRTNQVFKGIKVADFSWVMVGPTASKTLAEHGATVIRVESHRRPDILRIQAPFKDFIPGIDRGALQATNNTNKYGIALDISKPGGQAVAKKLIAWADIVTESFTPGTMKRLGLDYEEAKKINPNIIYYSTTSQGQYGPFATFGAYGAQSASVAGFAFLTGHPDHEPVHLYGAYTDFLAPWYLISALIGALDRRRKTGKGMHIDQSQVEAGITLMSVPLLDYNVNGRIINRMANRDFNAAPHGVYKCKGDDRWITIAVFNDEEWLAFCEGLGRPQLSEDVRFCSFSRRKENEDELDGLIANWIINHSAEEVMNIMQEKGVPSGIVQTAEGLFSDVQLKHRDHFVYLDHKVIGKHAYHNESVRYSKTPPKFWKAGPCLGEDNEYVFKSILGLSDDDISDLLAEGAITTDADAPAVGIF